MKILKAGGSYKLSGRLSKAGSKISVKLISELYNLSISKIREFQLHCIYKKKKKKKKKKDAKVTLAEQYRSYSYLKSQYLWRG